VRRPCLKPDPDGSKLYGQSGEDWSAELTAGSGVAWRWAVGRGADDELSASLRCHWVSGKAFRFGCRRGQVQWQPGSLEPELFPQGRSTRGSPAGNTTARLPPPLGARVAARMSFWQTGAGARSERVPSGGRRSAETALYKSVHEDFEHRRTPLGARAVALRRLQEASRSVASGWLSATAGAQEPQCTSQYMRIPSTRGCAQAHAQ